jgi:hypothetical protein
MEALLVVGAIIRRTEFEQNMDYVRVEFITFIFV